MVKEITDTEQRSQAGLAVAADGRGVGDIAAQLGVSRPSMQAWLRSYDDHGLEGLANLSPKPKSMPQQILAPVAAVVVELLRERCYGGLRRLV